jgi:hypothetical protein
VRIALLRTPVVTVGNHLERIVEVRVVDGSVLREELQPLHLGEEVTLEVVLMRNDIAQAGVVVPARPWIMMMLFFDRSTTSSLLTPAPHPPKQLYAAQGSLAEGPRRLSTR